MSGGGAGASMGRGSSGNTNPLPFLLFLSGFVVFALLLGTILN